MPDWSLFEERERKMAPIRAAFGPVKRLAIPVFEDCINYPMDKVIELSLLCRNIESSPYSEQTEVMIKEFEALLKNIQPCGDHPRIYLWEEGKMPKETEYTDETMYRYNHTPDFNPYMFSMPPTTGTEPKGAIVVCGGGDHGDASVYEGYQVAVDLCAMGYHCFHLLNRTNHNPWTSAEAGVDAARAVRYIRAHAEEYHIDPNNVAFAGFSNGGLTGEGLIEHFSGSQTVKDHFPDYEPDALDELDATPNAFICVYGPRHGGSSFDWTNVVYPPTFFAVGRLDNAMENLHYVYPDLLTHNVPVEVHTFAGTPHGQAGKRIMDGIVHYPNFELWEPLADAFLQDLFTK